MTLVNRCESAMDEWNDDDPLPELERDLKALFEPRAPYPEERERPHLRAARWRIAALRVRPWAPILAAASLLLLTLLGWAWFTGREDPSTSADQEARLAADVDGDGRVDVVDAYRLARRLAQGEDVPKRFDLDGDGAVDRGDVDLVLARAVSLGGER